MATTMRTCRVDGCENGHARNMLMCRRHWLGLPKPIRDHHWAVCREHGIPSEEWAESADACFAFWSQEP
jgi:hypothetical protein